MTTQPASAQVTHDTVYLSGSINPFDVLDACHQQIAKALEQMHLLVDRLESHGVDGETQTMARHIFQFFMNTARQHHADEEKHVFPALLRSGNPELIQHTLRLQQDHGWIEEDWQELAPQIEAIAAGYNWFNVDQLRLSVPLFAALYADHMALEESMVYPEARARMANQDVYGAGREMAERRRQKVSM